MEMHFDGDGWIGGGLLWLTFGKVVIGYGGGDGNGAIDFFIYLLNMPLTGSRGRRGKSHIIVDAAESPPIYMFAFIQSCWWRGSCLRVPLCSVHDWLDDGKGTRVLWCALSVAGEIAVARDDEIKL